MLIGLTGGIGSGKSTALACFADIGWNTMDADSICHKLYQDESCDAYREMVARWGNDIIAEDGGINRKNVANIVFQYQNEREWLNSILHPQVLDYAVNDYQQNSATVPMIFDLPLLFEVNWEKYFTKTIVVYVEKNVQIERLQARGMKEEEIKRRIEAQMPLAEKLDKADYGLINNGSEEKLREQCLKLHESLYGSSEPVKLK